MEIPGQISAEIDNMYKAGTDGPQDGPTVDEIRHTAKEMQLKKLQVLGDIYGLDLTEISGWQELCLRIADENHPDFKPVYEGPEAEMFHRLYGFTPIYSLKSKPPAVMASNTNGPVQ